MTLVADRARQLVETKVIRRVRTMAGVRRFKQPIGSIIVNDGLLVGLTDKGKDSKGRDLIEGANGRTYNITHEKSGRASHSRFVARDQESGEVVASDNSEMEVYAQLAQRVQQEAGIDVSGPGKLGSDGRREGWSENQVQAVGDELAAWGNSMEEYGHGLQDALYEVSGRLADGYSPHRDIRVARHELEQLRELAREADRDPTNSAFGPNDGAEATLNSAIDVAITEGKLPKKYNPDVEAAYAAEVLADAAANANKPRKIKTSEIGTGQWIRSTDKEGNPQGDWFKVSNISEQSHIPGRSRLISGVDRAGSKVRLYRQGPRHYWQTTADPKNVSEVAQPVQEAPVVTPVVDPTFTRMKTDYPGYGKFKLANGNVVYTDADDESVDIYDENDNMLANVPVGQPLTDKLNELGAGESALALPSMPPGIRHLTPAESEYDGYERFDLPSGRAAYIKKGKGNLWDAWDSNDTRIRSEKTRDDLLRALDADAETLVSKTRIKDEVAPEPASTSSLTGAQRRTVDSILNGQGSSLRRARELREYASRLEQRYGSRRMAAQVEEINNIADSLHGAGGNAGSEVATSAPTLKRLKEKFTGWKRFKMPDGKVIDVGQATEDDNRWYATGKGGWDDIVVDGDTEDEVMRKLNTMIGIEQPVTFSPSNTDVAPKREGNVQGMSYTPDQLERMKRKAGASDSPVLRSLLKKPGSLMGNETVIQRGTAADVGQPDYAAERRAREADRIAVPRKGDDPEEMRKSPSAELAEAEEERRAQGGRGSRLEELREAREAAGKLNQEMRRREPGPILGDMEPGIAAHAIHDLADDYEPTTKPYVTARRIANDLQEGRITTREAASELDKHAVNQPDMAIRQSFNKLADRLRNSDQRTPAQIREDAAAKREAARRSVQAERLTPDDSALRNPAPAQTGLADLDRNPNETLRNGRVLKDSDAKLLNLNGDRNGQAERRLVQPNNRNLNDRLMRLTMDDREAYVALQDRATENYLNGMTHAAAWKESIETAEKIPVPEHYTQTDATRDGRGEVRVIRRNPDGSYEDVVTIRPRTTDNGLWRAKQDATSRMNQENVKAKRAAARSVPVTGTPAPVYTPESAPAARTAVAAPTPAPAVSKPIPGSPAAMHNPTGYREPTDPEARSAEVQANVLQVVDQQLPNGEGWLGMADLRRDLASRGYTDRKEVDAALKKLGTGENPQLLLEEETNQKVLTPEDRAAGMPLGLHTVSIVGRHPNAVGATRPVARTTSVESEAATIDEAGARRLARENPSRFLRVVAHRYFKQGKDHRLKENARDKQMYDELNSYADQIDNGSGVASVIHAIRLGHAGMMGHGRTMMTIRKVLNEEYDK